MRVAKGGVNVGLYIPNAKVPVSCNKCYDIGLAHRLRDLGGHCPRMDLHYSPDEQSFKNDRRADCPLVDVPAHGRLIDADALTVKLQRHREYHSDGSKSGAAISNGIGQCLDIINGKECPTIISAEEVD